MPRRVDIKLRGVEYTAVIDHYADDPETNGCELEWHFDGVSPDEHDRLGLSNEEEEAVSQQIIQQLAEDDS